MQSSRPDSRPACGLHTHELWESFTDPDGDSHGYANSYCDGNGHCYSGDFTHANCNSHGYGYSDGDRSAEDDANTTASPNAAAKGAIGELIIVPIGNTKQPGSIDPGCLFSGCALGCSRC